MFKQTISEGIIYSTNLLKPHDSSQILLMLHDSCMILNASCEEASCHVLHARTEDVWCQWHQTRCSAACHLMTNTNLTNFGSTCMFFLCILSLIINNWTHALRLTQNSQPVVQSDDNHVSISGKNTGIKHVSCSFHVWTSVNKHHHRFLPAISNICVKNRWKQKSNNT